jgi:hypothetical protein
MVVKRDSEEASVVSNVVETSADSVNEHGMIRHREVRYVAERAGYDVCWTQ